MSLGTILYIGGFELPDKDAAAHRVISNGKVFREIGYNVIFIDVNRSSNDRNSFGNRKIDKGFEIWSRNFPSSIKEWINYLINIKDITEIINNYKDIKAIICYNFPSISLFKLLQYCKKKNIRLIADCTEWYEDKRIIKKLDTEIRMKYLHKKIDGVICISEYLEDYYKLHVKTVVIPPLVDMSEGKWGLTRVIPSNNIIHFVYSGNPGKHKDKLNYIIEAFSRIRNNKSNYKFTIIGLSKEKYLEFYPEHFGILNEMPNEIINFLGRVSHKKSIDLVKSADFQIFIREDKRVNNAGFPTKFVESMACGTPVITTNTSDLKNYMIDGKNGFFIESIEENSIEETLDKVVNMKINDIKKMKSNCCEFNVFNYTEFVVPLDSFFNEILKRGNKHV